MVNEDYFSQVWLVKLGFYYRVAGADVGGSVGEVSLDETLDYVEEDSFAVAVVLVGF